MTPVRQTKLYSADGIHNGNCYAACLASLLDLPLWMIPPFEDMFGRGGGQWRDRCEEWLARIFKMQIVMLDGHQVEKLPEFYIGNGRSKRGVMHSVIFSAGAMVHDPHLSDSGIESVEYTYHLAALGPA
jgi:hypothetical protein